MLITSEGEVIGTIGGGGMERLLVKEALQVLKENKPRILHFTMGVEPKEGAIPVDSKCGGEVKIFMDIVKPDPRLIILGSGLIAQATARYAQQCDFHVIVIDDAETATEANFSNMTLICSQYPDSLQQVEIFSSDYIAVIHGETEFELAGLRHAIQAEPTFIGLLGSRNKAQVHKEKLIKEGFNPIAVEKIVGPIGLDINAETPEEIGLSIVAQLILNKRG
jgi:xanthine dehydrogenase accessory factor